MCVCVHDWVCALCAGALGGHKRKLDPLELELQVIINYLTWVLGDNLGSRGMTI